MRRIVLAIAPPFNDNMLPIALGILKSLLAPAFEVTCMDLRLDLDTPDCYGDVPDPPDRWFEARVRDLLAPDPDLVGFSVYRGNRHVTLRLCSELRAARPELVLLLGGPEFTEGYRFGDDRYRLVDHVYQGEAETGVPQLFRELAAGAEVRTPGVWLRDGAGFSFTGPRSRLADLDAAPVPVYDDFQTHRYAEIPIQFSRGCNYNCVFCDNKQYFKTQEFRSARSLFAELETLMARHPHRRFVFVDDSLICSRQSRDAFLEFCRTVVDRRLDIQFRIYGIRVTPFLSAADVDLMARAGLWQVQIGLESASPAVRADMGKLRSRRETDRFVEAFLEKPEVQATFFMMYGYPTETVAEFEETFTWLETHAPRIHRVSFTPFNISAPYLARRDNLTFDAANPRGWRSPVSDLALRFEMFSRLLELLEASDGLRYNLTDPGFVRTYTRKGTEEVEESPLVEALRSSRALGNSPLLRSPRVRRAAGRLTRLPGRIRSRVFPRRAGGPAGYDIGKEIAFLREEYRRRGIA